MDLHGRGAVVRRARAASGATWLPAARPAPLSGVWLVPASGTGWAVAAVMLALAVAATVMSVAGDAVVGAADAPTAHLPGYWFTLANGDTVQQLLREGDTLWSATAGGGVVRFRVGTGVHRQYLAPQDGLPGNDVRALARDRAGTLWAGTAAGVARLDEATGRWHGAPAGPGSAGSAAVTALAAAADGSLWVGMEQRWDHDAPHPVLERPGAFVGGGLARFEPLTGRWSIVARAMANDDPAARVPGLPSDNVTSLVFDSRGALWVGTRPYKVWRDDACGRPDCPPELSAWGDAGGGLAASDDPAAGWRHWSVAASGGCLAVASHVSALTAGPGGGVWVGTRGRGLHAYLDGLAVMACRSETGFRHYERGRSGLPGNHVFSLAVDGQGRLWAGVGDGERGLGAVSLDVRGAADDPLQPGGDDVWAALGPYGFSGPLDAMVSAIEASDSPLALGTRDERSGDGWGVLLYDGDWSELRTALTGLPSNQVTVVAPDPRSGRVWIGTRRQGVSVWDGAGFTHHPAFGPGPEFGPLVSAVVRGASVITVAVGTEALAAAAGRPPLLVRLGPDRGLYELSDPRAAGDGATRAMVRPPLAHGFPAGTVVRAVADGPAGDTVTAVTFDRRGRAWVGARKTLVRPAAPGSGSRTCESAPDCWYDGGLAVWDGAAWQLHRPAAGDYGAPLRDVLALALDGAGRLWVGTGDPGSDDGDGVLVQDGDDWRNLRRATEGSAFGGDVVTGIAVDPLTGDVWLATHHGRCGPGGAAAECPANGRVGGGVSRFDGSAWSRWRTGDGSGLLASGAEGNFTTIAFDATRGRAWAGAWAEGSSSAHWLTGTGIDAAVSDCPRNCSQAAWQARRFPDQGAVRAAEIDGEGRLWVGASRDGRGLIPHPGGVMVLTDGAWSRLSSDTWSTDVTALARQGDGMWLGTFDGGAARWWPVELEAGAYLPVAGRRAARP